MLDMWAKPSLPSHPTLRILRLLWLHPFHFAAPLSPTSCPPEGKHSTGRQQHTLASEKRDKETQGSTGERRDRKLSEGEWREEQGSPHSMDAGERSEPTDPWQAPSQKGQSRHEGQKRGLKILKRCHRLKEISAKTTNTQVGEGIPRAWRCAFFPASPSSYSSEEDCGSEVFTTYATAYVSMPSMPYGSLPSHSVNSMEGFFQIFVVNDD